MGLPGLDFKNQYQMFGALTTSGHSSGNMQPHKNTEAIDFGSKSIEGIGGQSEAGKVCGAGQFAGANLSFVQRLDRMDEMSSLNRPDQRTEEVGQRLWMLG